MQNLSLKFLSLKQLPFSPTWLPWLKGLSSVLVTLAIVLLSDYAFLRFQQQSIPSYLAILTMLGSVALVTHILEAIVALFVNRSQRSAGQVIITTFFSERSG